MGLPKFYPGELEEATYTMSETENASYPLANLHTYLPNQYPWVSSNDVDQQWLKADFGSAKARNFVVIRNHNIDAVAGGPGVTVPLQASDVADFSSGVTDVIADLQTYGADDPICVSFASVTKRYWRILYDSSGALAVAPQIGQIFLNQVFAPAGYMEFPFRTKNEAFSTNVRRALDGVRRSVQPYKGILTFRLGYQKQDSTFESGWLRFHQKVRGALCPFYYQAEADDLWYLALDEDLNSLERFRAALNNLDGIRMSSVEVHQNPLS